MKGPVSREHTNRTDNRCHVICVCSGIGFPNGLAPSKRILMIGKSVTDGGVDFSVLHIGGSPTDSNTEAEGIYESIHFEYLPGTCKRSESRFLRICQYALGMVLAMFRIVSIARSPKQVCAYVFLGPGLFELVFCVFLHLARIPFVHEINEWWPGDDSVSNLAQWFRGGPCLSLSNGTIVISRLIEDRLRVLAERKNISTNILRIPVLVDSSKAIDCEGSRTQFKAGSPYLLWCGDITGYVRDVHFIIIVLSEVLNRGVDCRLVLVGSISPASAGSIRTFMKEHGVQNNRVIFTGYVSDDDMNALMRQSQALLLPLWNDDRSAARLPTKLGDYLLSGRPVITCGVGDLCTFLVNEESAFLCSKTDKSLFADKVCRVINDPGLADKVGQAGKSQAINTLDYRRYSSALAHLFTETSCRSQIWTH